MFSGTRLKELRIEQGYSQTDLANLLKINRASYSKWESGKSVPNQKHLTAIANILDVPVTHFESEYKIVNTYLQLNNNYRLALEDYADDLLQSQIREENKVIQLHAVDVLEEIDTMGW
ncbi:TPA: helix-turn-helix transcriptional regulator [Streptococcus suis]|uniref:helix-turn-helix domain-containing protein n=1 Tax=Streptococcus suis TaxID=1307 RepID=UPI001C97A8B9|nr:helix-turn-helix transcriptional regulator [Streptococcus suis]MBY5022699.1 helix-turn-helix domain-containing protein [Streptococcus suis]HEL1592417.1 helix-turn-helix transcriptional regulator [Streptococcus suis]